MPLDPQARAFLDQMEAAGIKPAHQISVEEAREATMARVRMMAGNPTPVHRVEDRAIPGPAGDLPVRIYAPRAAAPLPILVYFHGGGWIRGNIDSHDETCRALANEAECLVLSVDYRLAPEHPYPAAADDAYAATVWAAEHGREIGGDPARLAVGGDSAGGNLAAVVTLMARERGGPKIVHQLLVYPVTDCDFDTPSYVDNAEGYMLTRADMQYYWKLYVPEGADPRHPYCAPLRAEDLRGLPSAMVITAEYDPLRDEGEAYARRLRDAGVAVTSRCYPGMIHGFFGMAGAMDQGKQAIRDAAAALRAAFGSPELVGGATRSS